MLSWPVPEKLMVVTNNTFCTDITCMVAVVVTITVLPEKETLTLTWFPPASALAMGTDAANDIAKVAKMAKRVAKSFILVFIQILPLQ